MTIKDLFFGIINTPISTLFIVLVVISIATYVLGGLFKYILKYETRKRYDFLNETAEEKVEKEKKLYKRDIWFWGTLITINIVMWTYIAFIVE